MNKISFFLKTQKKSSAKLYIYGNLPELGNGDPNKGIPLENDNSDVYSHKLTIDLKHPPKGQTAWYSYFYRTKFGAIVREVCPLRFLNFSNCNCSFYDTFDIPTSIGDLIVRFRVHYKTVYGQELYVCGDPKEMGSWNPRRAVLLNYVGDDYWEGTIRLPLNDKPQVLYYKYIVYTSPRNFFWEGEENHKFEIGAAPSPTIFEINDVFHWNDPIIDVYSTSPFVDVINRRISTSSPISFEPNTQSNTVKINFIVKCPYVRPNQELYIVGSTPEVGEWDAEKGYKMTDYYFPEWKASIVFNSNSLPFDYKYCIKDKTSTDVIWESRPNRICPINLIKCDESFPRSIIINDWFTNPNTEKFKGFGISVPLSSLRSKMSVGIGQYTDLNGLVDYCNDIYSSLIQLLPINDTTTTGDWSDSFPYRQTSSFALHPIYIDLLSIKGVPQKVINEVIDIKTELDNLPSVDYPRVFSFKIEKLREIYSFVKENLNANEKFNSFIKHNTQWLQTYALFSVFRDLYGTADFRVWPEHQTITEREIRSLVQSNYDEVQFYYWIQFICNEQFKSARKYASDHGVVLKGDLPLGVSPYSVECWAYPTLFNLDMSAGTPPDFLNDNGENFEYPTYNWPMHATTDFSWWRLRLRRMADLFHAVQLDQMMGFFRMWEIPNDSCVRSVLGHFEPTLSFSRAELRDRGLLNMDRYLKPYVRWRIIKEKFGPEADYVAETFFRGAVCSREDQVFSFKDEFDSEVKIRNYLSTQKMDSKQRIDLERKLFELLSNVLLIEDTTKPDHYHVRAQMLFEKVKRTADGNFIPIESSSFRELPESQKGTFKELFYEYFYNRQTNLWLELATPKLKMLQESTNMLLCADDLGLNNEKLTQNLEARGFLSLRVQRMSRLENHNFDKVREFPYFSIATPSTPQMTTIRGWWEENREVIAKFWREEVWRNDEPPSQCECFIQELILKQHLWSDSMWTIFLLQDITGVDQRFRSQLPSQERINDPKSENQRWDYRYPFSIEELLDARDFSFRIRTLVEESKRK
ncbi:4-alpha-glucanotransferase DPE2 [Tritrichomonas foetus]|uniref:4-alpha-glucanotransferase n=1 Tax=Tritrichomonas foetus TaxID=1144522 RepID=A0A1J4L5M1_9EUKA|nr:4-alpha-glucanotransferase DPE2 [Tritrichomonas foetus]|eukprot:OHT17246.1 4-alpha-glucanotransferase DPE2 [Tritrichomonas foetus]